MEDDCFTPEDIEREFEKNRQAYVPTLQAMAEAGWSPPPGEHWPPFLIWLHTDGSMGFVTDEQDTDPGAYWFPKEDFDTPVKLLSILAHVSKKDWFRPQHVREMIAVFDAVFPGRVEF